MRILPIRKLLRVWNSMQTNPRAVAVVKTRRPRKPENIIIIIVRKISMARDIFVYGILWMCFEKSFEI